MRDGEEDTERVRTPPPRPGRRSWGGHSDDAAILTLLHVLGGTGCLFWALFPMTEHAAVRLMFGVAALRLGLAAVNLAAGRRLPRWALHVEVDLGVGCAGLLVAHSQTGAGALVSALTVLWLGVYGAMFFPRRQACLHAALSTAVLSAAMLATPAPVTVMTWAIVVASLWTAVVALSAVAARLRELARTDVLTGVLNRAGLFAAAHREMAHAIRTAQPLCIVAIDLDGLKAVNDAEGHLSGDRLLVSATDAWSGALRPHDILARTGGDEFIVIVPDATAAQAAAVVARLRLAHPLPWSAGISAWQPGEPFDACLGRADRALYAEKAGRRRDRADVLEPVH